MNGYSYILQFHNKIKIFIKLKLLNYIVSNTNSNPNLFDNCNIPINPNISNIISFFNNSLKLIKFFLSWSFQLQTE